MSGVLFLLPGTELADVVAAVRADLEPDLAIIRTRLDEPVSSRARPADVAVVVGAPVVPAVEVS